MDILSDILKQAELRLTRPRQEVFEILYNSEIPLTATEIVKLCQRANRTSVYRVLETFHQLHMISTVHVGCKIHYELAEPFIKHHHHLYCTKCKNAIPLEVPELEQFINYLGRRYAFNVSHHHFELEGVCARCQA